MNTFVLYSKPGCGQCIATLKILQKLDLPHEVKDISKDSAARDDVLASGYSSLPVVMIKDSNGNTLDTWSGFRYESIKQYA